MGFFDKVVKSVVGGAAKAVGGSKLLGTALDPTSIGSSIASEYLVGKMNDKGGGRGKVGRYPEVKEARMDKRQMIREARSEGPAAVKTARQEGRAGVQAARDVARTRIQQEKAAKNPIKPVSSMGSRARIFKDGGSVMKKDMKDMEGRALKRKTADAKGRAMKKTGKTGYGGVMAMPKGMKMGGAAKKSRKGC